MNITVSAPGKLHLLGEHTVVYGKPALIAAVNRRCTVTIQEGTKEAKETNATKVYIDFCLKEAFSFFKKRIPKSLIINPDLIGINLKSDIPLGSGMGSSAAIAVAIAGAVSKAFTGKINKEHVNEIAFNCEKYIHGNPSGGDNAVCTYGGLIWYQKKIIKPLPFSISKKISAQFSIINTGRPVESTKEMVSYVKYQISNIKYQKNIKNIFDEQEKLTYKLSKVLEKENERELKEIIINGEKNLEALGVVSGSTKKLIREIELAGGVAKISGAGGRKRASGIVLVFHNDFEEILRIAKQFNLECEKIQLGVPGLVDE